MPVAASRVKAHASFEATELARQVLIQGTDNNPAPQRFLRSFLRDPCRSVLQQYASSAAMKVQTSRLMMRFRRDERGGIALMFAPLIEPLIGLVGAAALLTVARMSGRNEGERRAVADATFATNAGTDASLVRVRARLQSLRDNGWRYCATGEQTHVAV
ncbi:MAG: hypothetical protein NT037_13935 [Hyphomicrobiales bacterium]|jgi:hypothetical protein|nr:hypothetical protein [Hyphomicrobiales bacterium]